MPAASIIMSDNEDNTILLFLASALGWTPELYNKINRVKCGEPCSAWLIAIVYTLAFLVDLADAVFDFILGFQTAYRGSEAEEGGKSLGILLLVMTVLGRFVTALYGRYAKQLIKDGWHEEGKATTYLFMELTVFMMEDGAAILLLAKTAGDSSSLDMLQTISLLLTLICALAFALTFLGLIVCIIIDEWKDLCFDCIGILLLLPVVGFPTFMVVILIQEVLVKGEEDPPFSGGLELASYIVYGIGSIIMGMFSVWAFLHKPK